MSGLLSGLSGFPHGTTARSVPRRPPIERIESLHSALRFRVLLGSGGEHKLEVVE